MNPRFRIAAFAALALFAAAAGLARADTSSAVPPDVEKALEAPKATVPYLDYASCPTPGEQQKVQIKATLEVPDEDRGQVIDKGSCAVSNNEQWPTTVDNRYAIGE